jgi:hypothetical protein
MQNKIFDGMPARVALAGYARVGKDEAAKVLIERGWTRSTFADIIKGQVDALITKHFKFSAFTEVTEEKAKIRGTLVAFGEDNYAAISEEYFAALPEVCVNTRLARIKEALRWKELGGVIVEVQRVGVAAESEWSSMCVRELRDGSFIDATIINDDTIEELQERLTWHLKRLAKRMQGS